MLIVNNLPIAYALPAAVPWMLRVGAPISSTMAALAGLFYWTKSGRKCATIENASKHLAPARALLVMLNFVSSLWALLLFGFIDLESRAIVGLLIYLEAAGCAVCLVSFPSAARLTLLVSGIPIVLWLLASGDHTLVYIASDLLLTTMLLMTVLAAYHCR